MRRAGEVLFCEILAEPGTVTVSICHESATPQSHAGFSAFVLSEALGSKGCGGVALNGTDIQFAKSAKSADMCRRYV